MPDAVGISEPILACSLRFVVPSYVICEDRAGGFESGDVEWRWHLLVTSIAHLRIRRPR